MRASWSKGSNALAAKNAASFIRTMEGTGEIAFGPFRARYSPQSHNGSAYVELAIIDDKGQLRY